MSSASPSDLAGYESEPIFAATVYNNGQHDRLLDEVIRPRWEIFSQDDAGRFLWTMRFGARGEHIKLRIHGPDRVLEEVEVHLVPALDKFVASLTDEMAEESATAPPGSFPAIDLEDAEPGVGVGWRKTTFRPSPFVLGGTPLVEDPAFGSLFARTQGAMAEAVLKHLVPKRHDPNFPSIRQTFGVRLVLAALIALPLDPAEQVAYLRYHRDWFARYIAVRKHLPESRIPEILEPLDRKVERAAQAKESLARSLEEASLQPPFLAWTNRLRAVYDRTLSFRGDPRFDLDPYTDNVSFLPLFKTLQGSANQAGLAIGSELWAYHLLLTVAEQRLEQWPRTQSGDVA